MRPVMPHYPVAVLGRATPHVNNTRREPHSKRAAKRKPLPP